MVRYLALVEEGAGAGADLAHDALAGEVVGHHGPPHLGLAEPHQVVALGVRQEPLVHEDPRLPRHGLDARRVERRRRRHAVLRRAQEEHRHDGGGHQQEHQDEQHAAEPHTGRW